MAPAATARDRFVTVNGLRLRYRDWGGGGRPCLALHGAAAHAHWWDPVAPSLRPRLRVLALDWRGHGRSAWPRPPAYRSEDLAADLAAVIARLRLERVVIAGHSMGGQAALAFAAWHPGALDRLIVVDAKPASNLQRLLEVRARGERPRPEFPTRAAALRRFRLSPPETTAAPDFVRAIGARGIGRLASGRWAYRFDPACERTRIPVDAWPLLPDIAAPTLIVRGERSTILTREMAERMAKLIPSARLEEIPGAYHHVTLDAPAAVAECFLAWLT
ncbi:MAG TPA: alpha/beta hydrolase [Methylomirabilota bacterium]|jgi:pimeloyl-ACP methyl ester carboxylesterase|nr:alpha/beta hydrolase [Methylomirabilota bacterium]